MLIGLSGLAGSGKTTIARAIELHSDKSVEIVSFAAPIKKMIQTLLMEAGIPNPTDYTHGHHKNDKLPIFGHQTARHALQSLGTEWGRDLINVNLWTDIAMSRADISGADIVVFDDVRFGTEVAEIRKRGGKIIRLDREGVERTSAHSSETLPLADILWMNNDTPEGLAKVILKWMTTY